MRIAETAHKEKIKRSNPRQSFEFSASDRAPAQGSSIPE
jgi:hypothetical protein